MCWKECVYRCSKKCSKSCSQWVQKTFIWHLLPFLLMIVIINRIYWSAILRCQITHKIMLYLTADLISLESWNANCALKWMPFCIFMLNSHVREHVWNYWTYQITISCDMTTQIRSVVKICLPPCSLSMLNATAGNGQSVQWLRKRRSSPVPDSRGGR